MYQAWLNLLPLFLFSSKLQWNSFLSFNSWPGFPALFLCYHCLLLLVSFCPIKYLFLYFVKGNWSCPVSSLQGSEAKLCSLVKEGRFAGLCHVSPSQPSLVLQIPSYFPWWPLATSGALADSFWEAGGITWFFRENLPVHYSVWLLSVSVPVSHGLFQSVNNKVYVSDWGSTMSISSLPSLAAIVPGPEPWGWLADGSIINSFLSTLLLTAQLEVLLCMPVHASAGCSALHCSGLQHNPVFPYDSLFSLVLMTPPGLVSSTGLHSHTFLLVDHPGGNKVKAVLKASCSAGSPFFVHSFLLLHLLSQLTLSLFPSGDESSWMGEHCLRQNIEQGPGCGWVPLLAVQEHQADFKESIIREK